jgi:glycosyltransferase involved in cell wall biosynthesis
MKDISKRKVAIVCDWLTGIGGAERVVLELHRMFPEAPIYTSQYDPAKIDWFKDADVRTTWLQNLPKGLKKFLPVLRARAFEKLDLSDYDLVISSSGAEAKAVKIGPKTVHVCYCHAPTHYYWSRYEDYMQHPGFGVFNPLARFGLRLLVKPLRKWDYRAAQQPTHMLANSTHTAAMIQKYYDREATVVFPPVDIERFEDLPAVERNGFVVAGRQTPYKRIDLAVAACTQLDLPLTVIGNGPEHQKLRKLAGPSVTFVTDASDQDVAGYFAGAEAFIFPNLDDFGITPVEAMAAGTPVIAYRGGGALDYVRPGKSGTFFDDPTVPSLVNALSSFNPSKYSSDDIKSVAREFSRENFVKTLQTVLDDILQ